MDMYHCVMNTSSEGLCLFSSSVSGHIGVPNCVISAGVNMFNSFERVKRFFSRCGEEIGVCSCPSSRLTESKEISKSESVPHNKSTVGAFSMSSSTSSLLKKTYLHTNFYSTKTTLRSPRCQKESSTLGVDLLSSIVISRYLVFLLMILFRSVLVEGVPVHKTRHHLFKPEDLPLCSHRFRREIQSMNLKESETAGLCPSRACLDIDERRRPIHIIRVFCLQSSNSTCSTLGGDFQCTQVHTHMEIWQEESKPSGIIGLTELWTTDNKTRAMVPSKIRVEHGCICGSESARPAVNPVQMVV